MQNEVTTLPITSTYKNWAVQPAHQLPKRPPPEVGIHRALRSYPHVPGCICRISFTEQPEQSIIVPRLGGLIPLHQLNFSTAGPHFHPILHKASATTQVTVAHNNDKQ
jgi:hypothetical protein